MDFRPVEAIGAVSPVSLKRPAKDVAPPFAIDGAGGMEEDSHGAGAEEAERGLEEEGLHEAGEEEDGGPTVNAEPPKKVNFFA